MQEHANPAPQQAPQAAPPGYDHRPAPHAGQPGPGYSPSPQRYGPPPHDVRGGFESRIAQSLVSGSIWVRLFAYMSIVGGALYCLSIVGIIFGWLPILMGLWLINADKAGQRYAQNGDPEQLLEYVEGVRKYFMAVGVLTAISLVCALLMVLFYGAIFGALGLAAFSAS